MLEALERMGLSDAQIDFLSIQIIKGNAVFLEETDYGEYDRVCQAINAHHHGMEVCDTQYFNQLEKYNFDVETVETIFDLVQESCYQASIDDKLDY